MTFTYDTSTDIGKLRLAIADTSEDDAEFTDEELQVFIDLAGSWSAAAILAVDALIAKYAKLVSLTVGPRREEYGQIVEHYRVLRANLVSGVAGEAGAIDQEDLTFSWVEEDDEDDYS